jgi:prepilin-type processing-associated H-X9-DG protein
MPCYTNYIAIIGPGTAWRDDGPVKFSDLPDNGSHTVMAVEVVNSGVHWAEPRDLTVDEALEGLKTGKGLRISSAHPGRINILFADVSVKILPSKMPISVWRELLAGEIKDLDNIEKMIDPSAPDMVDVSIHLSAPDQWKIILGAIVWLLSVVLLFRRAIKSRRIYCHSERSEESR